MADASGPLTLHLERLLPASPAYVFALHADPDAFARWWGPRGFSIPDVLLDVRVGGTYRVVMQPPEGDAFVLTGEFVRVEPPNVLGYTFRWEPPDPDDQETTVTLTFTDAVGSTRLTLDQGVFRTQARLDLHAQGWSDTLDRLSEVASATA